MNASERRRHVRESIARPCKVLEVRTGRYLAAVTSDLSDGGALVELLQPTRCRRGDRLLMAVPARGDKADGDSGHGVLLPRDAMVPSTVVRVSGGAGRRRIAMRFDHELPRRADRRLVQAA